MSLTEMTSNEPHILNICDLLTGSENTVELETILPGFYVQFEPNMNSPLIHRDPANNQSTNKHQQGPENDPSNNTLGNNPDKSTDEQNRDDDNIHSYHDQVVNHDKPTNETTQDDENINTDHDKSTDKPNQDNVYIHNDIDSEIKHDKPIGEPNRDDENVQSDRDKDGNHDKAIDEPNRDEKIVHGSLYSESNHDTPIEEPTRYGENVPVAEIDHDKPSNEPNIQFDLDYGSNHGKPTDETNQSDENIPSDRNSQSNHENPTGEQNHDYENIHSDIVNKPTDETNGGVKNAHFNHDSGCNNDKHTDETNQNDGNVRSDTYSTSNHGKPKDEPNREEKQVHSDRKLGNNHAKYNNLPNQDDGNIHSSRDSVSNRIPFCNVVLALVILGSLFTYLWLNYDTCNALVHGLIIVTQCKERNLISGHNNEMLSQADGYGKQQRKHIFRNINDAFSGYNIFRGYPLASVRDPGFSLPIFHATYSEDVNVSDFKYDKLKGYEITLNKICSTSFSSSISHTRRDLHKLLYTIASFDDSLSGSFFSMNKQHQEFSDLVSRGKYVVIHSFAYCYHYDVKLLSTELPHFSNEFRTTLLKLNQSHDKRDYIEFLNMYGTHFVKDIKLGSSLILEHKISYDNYERLIKLGVNITQAANDHSAFNALGTCPQSVKKRTPSEIGFSFTRNISRGPPPTCSGKDIDWALKVKDNFVAVKYKLAPIENLFTSSFMSSIKVDFRKIGKQLRQTIRNKHYSRFFNLSNTFTKPTSNIFVKALSVNNCLEKCIEYNACVVASYREAIYRKGGPNYNLCYMITTDSLDVSNIVIYKEKEAAMIIVTPRIYHDSNYRKTILRINNAEIVPGGSITEVTKTDDFYDCFDRCYFTTANCAGITWYSTSRDCRMYRIEHIHALKINADSFTTFCPPKH